MSKTLLIKLSTDVSGANDAQIDALKAFYRATFEQIPGMSVDCEVLTQDEPVLVDRLSLSLVRSAFLKSDSEADEDDEDEAEYDDA